MGCTSVPYSRVPKSSKLYLDYLSQFDRLKSFFSSAPFDPAGTRAIAERIQIPPARRREVADILERQNRGWGCAASTFENIQRLSEPETVADVDRQTGGVVFRPRFTPLEAAVAVVPRPLPLQQGRPGRARVARRSRQPGGVSEPCALVSGH